MNAPTTVAEHDVLELVEPTKPAHALAHQGAAPLATTQPSDSSPFGMVMAAFGRGASLEQIEKVLDLQQRWEDREAQKRLNAAFAAFKEQSIRIIKSQPVTDGPLKGKKYAELHSVVDAVTPILSRHGLATSWKITKDDRDWIEVTCTLRHVGGATESVSLGGPPDTGGAKNAIQARASTVSYLERYTLKAILGVAEGGDDDDGNGGKQPAPADGKAPPPPAADPSNGLPHMTPSHFTKNFPAWKAGIEAGRKTPEDVISTVSTRYVLDEQQLKTIRACQAQTQGQPQ